ncbi:MAG: hypothetical protein IV104_22030 [Acidovorax sp.]|nr:hypothetical protein [Acidovorax sp.]
MKTLFHRIVLLTVVASAIVIVVLLAAFLAYSDVVERETRHFEAIQEGSSRPAVVAALGNPSRVRPCGEHLWWGHDGNYRGKNDGRCVMEERYDRFLVAFGVGYSADGKVVSKYQYVSE